MYASALDFVPISDTPPRCVLAKVDVIKSEDYTYNMPSKYDDQRLTDDHVKTILKSVSGRLRSSELTAIMGPSGAGKSTLLNILTGYKTSGAEGSITMNGHERNLSAFRKLSCYIMQDNQLHMNLTVEEAMKVAANLKLGSHISQAEKEEVIKEILEILGLSEHRRTMTSNLSGGQKKRLSIALELVNNPPIMFFDEPTSGLDSSSCFQCISLLKTLARGGRTIICTIHQPSARLFEMFDALYTLAEGQCVYQGSTSQLVPFLRTIGLNCPSYHNPASFIIEVSCGEYGDNIKNLINAINNGKYDIREGHTFPETKDGMNNCTAATGILKNGDNVDKLKIKNKNDISNLEEKFQEEKTGEINNGKLIPGYATNDIAKQIPLELPVLLKENFNRWYSLKAYYLAITISDIPFQTIFCVLYVTVVYFLTSQPADMSRFSMFVGTCLLISFVAQSVGLVVGAAMNVQNGVFLAPVMSVPFLLFSGFFVSFDAIPVYLRWITYLSYIRYGFEGTALTIYGYGREKLKCFQVYCHFKNPETTLEELDMLDADFTLDILALVLIFVVLRISAYLFLRWKIKTVR
ncbi:hypothetical protein PUN28_018518 [Cardiocondyla obscurior]|uniref:ABC transporter domain-containing protein n=1 Tax=Cardiocondyla obscurior TaxID=286306 RepID=A0AAW2EGF3_9HYME